MEYSTDTATYTQKNIKFHFTAKTQIGTDIIPVFYSRVVKQQWACKSLFLLLLGKLAPSLSLFYWFSKATLCAWTIPLTLSPSVCITANWPIIPFSTGCRCTGWILSRRERSDYNNNNILCHLPTVACINFISLAHSTPSPLPRAECLPQHGGSCGQQHPVGSGLYQTADLAAVCTLLPPSPSLWPQCRATPEERHPAAGWVSQQVIDWAGFHSLLGYPAGKKGEGSGKYAAVVWDFYWALLCLMHTHTHTHGSSVQCLWISTLQVLGSQLQL